MWVTSEGNATVYVVQVSTGNVLGSVAVGNDPNFDVFDGVNVWVTNSVDASVSKIARSQQYAGTGTYSSGGSSPIGIASDGANVSVANGATNSVGKL